MTRYLHSPPAPVRASAHRSLRREIVVVLLIKLLLLIAGFWFFFGPDTRPTLSSEHIHEHLSPAAATDTDEDL